ncbi:hypothetical protein RGQ29_023760 [Quercus rubra]|uniref:DUF7866 domain-containing protein n=1 Tax=Quercus rubra TaxID=3512 RepID=A0AAN7IRE1_QUERU|nr:hypothetical protein RGQ29_023760 [Quercus rubra]
MANFTINNKLILSLFIFVQFIIIISTQGSNAKLMPVETSTKTLVPIGPNFEIGFPGFPDADAGQICSKCTCCRNPSTKEGCTTQRCCFSAKCNIPQKPPKYCVISPIKCNCDSCSSA